MERITREKAFELIYEIIVLILSDSDKGNSITDYLYIDENDYEYNLIPSDLLSQLPILKNLQR